jgi:hypothetical protein
MEIENKCSKARGMYMHILPSDFAYQHQCNGGGLKIVLLHSRNVTGYCAALHEALGDCAPQHWQVARLVEAFKGGRVSTVDMHYRGCSVSICSTTSVVIIQQCMSEETHWTTNKLAEYTGISRSTVLQMLWCDLNMHETAAKWVTHNFNEMQLWMRCDMTTY